MSSYIIGIVIIGAVAWWSVNWRNLPPFKNNKQLTP
ncbi:protein of unknown function [Rhodovastum atsumiense]|nr:protein of unknown function [Rhodovastum atsumiense]